MGRRLLTEPLKSESIFLALNGAAGSDVCPARFFTQKECRLSSRFDNDGCDFDDVALIARLRGGRCGEFGTTSSSGIFEPRKHLLRELLSGGANPNDVERS